jgi:uncharacterized protein YjbI with pentapeptide repeats
VLEDTRVKDCVFTEFTARRSRIRNVTFEDCRFVKADFYESELENVVFKGGEMTYKGGTKRRDLTEFSLSVFENVVIDGVRLSGVYMGGLDGNGDG